MLHIEEGPCLNVLVAYYSYSGGVKAVAQALREKTCGVLYGVETRKQYAKRTVVEEAIQELREGTRPALKHAIPSMTSYDFILVGGPVWEYTVPSPLMTFLHGADFLGKNIAAFCTHEGGVGSFFLDFKSQARNAEMMDGLELPFVRRSAESLIDTALDAWLAKLGLVKPLAAAV